MAEGTAAGRSGAPVLSRTIAEELATRIMTGVLAPGARIKQDEIAAEFSTSRIPVREALRMLESRGLVVLKSNSGAWVTELSMHDLSMSYMIRERIEPLLLLDSLPGLTDADHARMRDIQAEIASSTDVDRFLVLDREFHWCSYGAHRSPELAAMVERLWDTTQAYRRAFTRWASDGHSWVISAEHDLLLEAVVARDADTASAMLETHIRRTRLELQQHPEVWSP